MPFKIDFSYGPVSALISQATGLELRKPESIQDAARQFEALLIAKLLENVKVSTLGSLDEDPDSSSQTMFHLACQVFAEVVAEGSGLGLATLIAQGLEQQATPQGGGPSAQTSDASQQVLETRPDSQEGSASSHR